MRFWTIVPGSLVWVTPREAHSDQEPFCDDPACACHHEPERVEQFLVAPVERGEIDIPAALDRYYARQLLVAGRK